ncbi:hypothetical protein [Aureliella helgolandensis]|uniref:Uncharacterized protein n=1 Tax=Aureliella helgolandensis TaxID=2527968 RepID=A0A518GAF6_9BACT|nr:hypothetical protein [Aureliella helgolandensis]QDV25560.1 hypothetical protein Q31a_38860 [Aureliella helgolandensis]
MVDERESHAHAAGPFQLGRRVERRCVLPMKRKRLQRAELHGLTSLERLQCMGAAARRLLTY